MMSYNLKFFSILLCLVLVAGCASKGTTPSKKGEYDYLLSQSEQDTLDQSKLSLETFESAEEAKGRAEAALRGGDTQKAIFYYVKAIEIDNADSDSFRSIADIYYQESNVPLAIVAYKMVLQIDPADVHARERLGLSYLKQSQYLHAKDELLQVVELSSTSAEAYNGLAVIADIFGDLKTANEYYGKAIKVAPYSDSILNNFAYSLYLAGDWDKAEQYFLRLLKRYPRHPQGNLNYGLLLARKDSAKEAYEVFRRVLPPSEAYNELGYIYLLSKRYEDAVHLFQLAIESSPHYFAAAYKNLEHARSLAPQRNTGLGALANQVVYVNDLVAEENEIRQKREEEALRKKVIRSSKRLIPAGKIPDVGSRYTIQ